MAKRSKKSSSSSGGMKRRLDKAPKGLMDSKSQDF